MKVSRNLLSNYINLDGISDAELAKRLTFAGIEVETYEKLSSATGLIVGEVLTQEKVENSDHLSLCSVNLGPKDGIVQIICGAPNVAAGQKVIVAQVGAVLPELTIKKTTIKGLESNGMICALNELGVDESFSEEDNNGIYVLPNDAKVGNEEVLKYLGLDDTIFDIRPLANRSDMLAIYNIVKELSALFNRPFTLPNYSAKQTFKAKLTLDVRTKLVQAFTLTEVTNIQVAASPKWLRDVLIKHGFRPINNIVDIGNYVMLLTGRPLHMYDLDDVYNEAFIVSDDLKKSFIGLDEKSYVLLPGDQVIHDEKNILCLGGVLGALLSSVTPKTKRIAIEVAVFSQPNIRLSATRLNLVSEASSRFSKGVNEFNTHEALMLALHLLNEMMPNITISETVNYEVPRAEKAPIFLDDKRINTLLGTKFTKEEMIETLLSLCFIVKNNREVIAPPHRADIDGLNDLAEEIIRVRGFEHIKTALPNLETTVGEYDAYQKARMQIRTLLAHRGLYETLNYTLTTKESLEAFKYLNKGTPYALEHPMTPLRSHLRLNLLPSLLETLSYNANRQQENAALFEISEVISKEAFGEHLAFVMMGEERLNGALNTRPYDFYDAKGLVEMLMAYLNIGPSRFKFLLLAETNAEFHPAQSVEVLVDNRRVGVFGVVHPTALKSFGIKNKVIAGELDLKTLLHVKTSNGKVIPPSRFPFVVRDLALLINKDIPVADVLNAVKKAGGRIVRNVEVFDVYTKLLDDTNRKSVALSITLLDETKTLVDADIKGVIDKVISQLQTKLQAEVRS